MGVGGIYIYLLFGGWYGFEIERGCYFIFSTTVLVLVSVEVGELSESFFLIFFILEIFLGFFCVVDIILGIGSRVVNKIDVSLFFWEV